MSDAILIQAAAIKNVSVVAGGWLPVIIVDGVQQGDTWAAVGYSRADALDIARREAEKEAKKFVGDWNVIVVTQAEENGE